MSGFLLGFGSCLFFCGTSPDSRAAGAFLAGMPIGYYALAYIRGMLSERRPIALTPEMLKQIREDTSGDEKQPPPVGFGRG